jgi:DUF971 family protein
VAEPVKIEVEGGSVRVTWDDGRRDDLSAETLRAACPCAGCREPGGRRNPAGSVAVLDARLVGGYAVNLTFGPDGHATGIYPYGLLRSLGDGGREGSSRG